MIYDFGFLVYLRKIFFVAYKTKHRSFFTNVFVYCQDDDYDDGEDTFESHLHGKSVEVFYLPENEDMNLPLDMDSAQLLLKFKEVIVFNGTTLFKVVTCYLWCT